MQLHVIEGKKKIKSYFIWFTPTPLSLRCTLPIKAFQQLVSKLCSLKKKPNSLEKKDLKMEVFKLGKIIENRVIDVQLALHKVEEAR